MNYVYLLCRQPWQRYKLNQYRRIVQQAGQLEPSLSSLDEQQLQAQVRELHNQAQSLPSITTLIPRALALGREISRRTLQMRHYDVQLIGALALYEGHIAEMDTGEGKTLMAPLAAFLHRLGHVDRSTHIVTANEYLAARDAQWMAPLLKGLQMTVGLIVPGQGPTQRIQAYQNDVVYATAKEIVFDSLQKKARKKTTSAVDAILRPHEDLYFEASYDFAIVDEVDSVLIDQARSPLSIGEASRVSPQLELYRRADAVAGHLVRGSHYRLMHDDRSVELKDEGKAEARNMAQGVLRYLPSGHKWERYVTCALAARYIYKLDQQYVIRDGKIVLIDENTGRMLPGRQLPDGIHQALEIRNNIIPSAELRGNFMTTFQTYFRKYGKLAGMTGTASMAAYEFMSVFNLTVLPIPPNKPSRRKLLPDLIYRHRKSKFQGIIEHIIQIHATGRPILIGTGSVQISEYLSHILQQQGLQHEVLNAKNHAREAEIIAQAGFEGRITVITNMAGRGVDIKLGPGVADKGGVYLIGTDRAHYRRLDQQLTGRVGRQGDPGDCQFLLSLKDDLLRYAKKKKITRLRLKTRNQRNTEIKLSQAEKIFQNVQHHIHKITQKQRHKIFQGEKHREKMKKEGLWEDWMDVS